MQNAKFVTHEPPVGTRGGQTRQKPLKFIIISDIFVKENLIKTKFIVFSLTKTIIKIIIIRTKTK